MTWPNVPTDGRRGDWFRLAANAINYLLRKVEGALGGLETVSGSTGWAVYNHGGGSQALTADTRTKLVIDGAMKIESQLPQDSGPLWDTATNTITGREGDSIVIKVQFVFTPGDAVASHLDFEVDIGGGIGVVESETKEIFKGAGMPHQLSFPVPAYTLDTWAANGGEVYLTVDGPGSITTPRIVILRTHKAR